jgi:hypothetical protein
MAAPDPGHANQAGLRTTFRIAGPIVFVLGFLLTISAMVDFFGAMGSFSPPRNFWMAFVGLPLIAVGAWLTQAGFVGAATRYVAGEVTPVLRDAIGAGRACPACGGGNAADATFCDDCGERLPAG